MTQYSRKAAIALREKIHSVLKQVTQDHRSFDDYDLTEIIETVNIYHTELEYQNEELKRTQEQLVQSQREYMSLFDDAPIPYVVYSEDGTMVKHNAAFVLWAFKGAKDNSVSDNLTQLIAPESQDDFYFHIRQVLTAKSSSKTTLTFVCKGKTRRVEVTSSFYAGDTPNLIFIRSALVDITDLVDAQERAQSANEAKGVFLSNMSHEIRTPMNGLVGMADLILETQLDVHQQHYATVLKRSAQSLLSILNDILDYSKIESGHQSLTQERFNLSLLIQDVVMLFQPVAYQKGINLKLELDQELDDLVMGDPVKIRQVFSNLISNAVKFTRVGCVSVSAKMSKLEEGMYQVKAVVSDTGIGIQPHALHRIFNRYEQGGVKQTNEFAGTGLGLAIVRGIIRLMSGEIKVESEPGVGSTFRIHFNVKKADKNLQEQDSYSEVFRLPTSKTLPIIIADDDEASRLLLGIMLRKRGYKIVEAINGLEAVNYFKNNDVSMVIMDIQMPLMTGLEAVKEMKRNGRNQNALIIAMTAYAMKQDQEFILTAGFDRVLTKPIVMPENY